MLHLIPRPSGNVEERGGRCPIPAQCGAALDGLERWALIAFERRMGIPAQEGSWLQVTKDPSLPAEGYVLDITPEGLRVEVSAEAGLIWALTTAAALAENGSIPCCRIEDAPKYAHRGLNLDCARHFFPAAEVKKIIEEMSLAKLNVLHWHLADDQGWRIESKRFPKLHKKSKKYYTAHEIRGIVEYARLRGVEIIPEIDLPGHTTAILAAYPQYSCSGEKQKLAAHGGIYPVILCPGQDETLTFLQELLEEIIPLFPGCNFHIGGDEAPKTEWKKCPHCAARMQALGLTEPEDLQGWFTGQVAGILAKHGRRAICWNDSLLAAATPADITVQYWTLQHRKQMEAYVNQGGSWIYSDMFELYLDYPYSMSPMKKVYTAQPHLGKHPETRGLLGLEACLWTEQIREPYRLETMLFPRLLALAENAWSGPADYARFLQRLERWIRGSLHASIAYMPKENWDPKGSKRRKEALAFFAAMNAGLGDNREATVETAAPDKEFTQAFIRKFFRPGDLPYLLRAMRHQKKA